MKEPIIAVTMGDPCGIGPEIVALSLQDKTVWKVCSPVVIGQKEVFDKAIEITKANVEAIEIEGKCSAEEKMTIKEAKASVEKHGGVKIPFVPVGDVYKRQLSKRFYPVRTKPQSLDLFHKDPPSSLLLWALS